MILVYIALFAGQFDATFREGLIALNQNNLAVAESKLESATQLEPHNGRAWVALAQTYWKEHKAAQARSAAQSADAWAGDDAIARNALKLFYSEDYYFQIAQLDLNRQNFAVALETLDTGRKKFSNSAQLELAAGVAYYGLRRFPEAIDAFLRTIQLDGTIEQPYVFLGRMLDQAERKLPAVTQAFAGFAARAPDSYLSNFLYGKALAVADDTGAAEASLRKSIAQNGGYWESRFELGLLLERRQKFDDAARELKTSADLNPRDPVIHYHLARVYDRLGKTAEAQAERELHARLAAESAPAGYGMTGIK